MPGDNFDNYFRELAQRFCALALRKTDGVPERELERAEARLRIAIPTSLRAYYSCAGRFVPFSSAHHRLRPPDELAIEDGYLVYMDENQEVVSWGIGCTGLDESDPIVWQRNNTPPVEWFSENKTFTTLMLDMFIWYDAIGVWDDAR
jgi:hypothetical protein